MKTAAATSTLLGAAIMSVFSSGLSRLKNSFSRKSGRASETRSKFGGGTKEAAKAARAERPWSQNSCAATSSQETVQGVVSSHGTGQGDSSSRRRGHAVRSSVTDHDAGLSCPRLRDTYPPPRANHGLVSSPPSSSSGTAHYSVASAQTARSAQNHPADSDSTGNENFGVTPFLENQEVELGAGVSDDCYQSGRLESTHVCSSTHTASASLQSSSSSSSSLTTTNLRRRLSSGRDTDGSLSSPPRAHGNAASTGDTSNPCDDLHAVGGTTAPEAARHMDAPENSGNIKKSASGDVELTGRHDNVGDDYSSSKGSNDPVAADSDGSYDHLPFADACDRVMGPSDHELSLRDPRDTVGDTRTANTADDVKTPETRESGSLTPTLRTTPSMPNPNRVSFGTSLQQVLCKAEQARGGDDERRHSGNEDREAAEAATTAPACEIPQTLKESLSLLALHKNPMEDITCRACGELFRGPRILPCLHTFCSACVSNLQTYPVNVMEVEQPGVSKDSESRDALSPSPVQQDSTASSSSFSHKSGPSSNGSSSRKSSEFYYSVSEEQGQGQAESGRVVLCPTCLKETTVSGTLQELPRNYVLERRVAEHEATVHRGGVRQECDSCGERGEAPFITARCVECAENLCSLCELSHRRQKKTKRHQVLDVTPSSSERHPEAQETRGSSAANRRRGKKNHVTLRDSPRRPPCSGRVSCGRHPEEELKLFCLSCDLPVCRDCVVLDHRDHDCQFLSKELFKGQMSQVQQLIRSVVPRITSVDQQLKKVADTQEQIRSRADDVTREIQTHMDRFLSAIQQHRQRLLQQVGVVVEEKQHALHVTERHLRQVRADVEHTCRFVSDMIESASDVEILSVKRLVTERLSGLQEVSVIPSQAVSSFMRFAPSETGEIINHFQMFGRVLSRRASAAASTVFSEGLSTARVGHESSVVLRVNGEDGAHYHGKDVHVKAWLILQNQAIRSFPVSVTVQKNGTYILRFSPVQPGPHSLHVAVDTQPVKESPFKFKVKGQWRVHKGAWHCCSLCSTGGRGDVPCACRGIMPGGQLQGCSHAEPGHPGGHHWSCCGKMVKSSECSGMPMPCTSPVRQVTL